MKIGPGAELEVAVALVPDRRARDVRRHQVGRELDAAKPSPLASREGARGQRLREARERPRAGRGRRRAGRAGRARAARACRRRRARPRRRGGRRARRARGAPSDALQRRHDAVEPGLVDARAVRSAGCGRSGRTSSQASSPSAACAARARARGRCRGGPRAARPRARAIAGRRRKCTSNAAEPAIDTSRSSRISAPGRSAAGWRRRRLPSNGDGMRG